MISPATKVAVITGASSGIGKAIAEHLATEDTFLCLLGRRLDALNSLSENLKSRAAGVLSYRVDLTQDEDILTAARNIQSDCGGVDVLIHSAGVIRIGPFESSSIHDFDFQFRVNVRGPYLLTQVLLPSLKSTRGQVVFINSTAGLNAPANVSQYAATKHALKAITDSLRNEVNSFGVRVISVYPGRTATPMQEKLREIENAPYHTERLLQPADVAAVVTHALTLPRTAEITDLIIRPLQKP